MDYNYDLHIHTTASDGILSPQKVINSAREMGLMGIAITDHDTVGGVASLDYNNKSFWGIEVIPGIELNTEHGDSEVHILGYFIDIFHPGLADRLEEIKNARYDRARKMTAKLKNMGLGIDFLEVEKLARGDLIGRPHIAQALAAKRYVFSIREAFEKYIGKGRPAYVPRYKFDPQEAISLVKNAGGITVLAHPGLIKNSHYIYQLIEMGIEGLEVYYPEHNQQYIKRLKKLSSKYNLVMTGGSDFHGSGSGGTRDRLGCTGISRDLMEKILVLHHEKLKNTP